MAIDAISGATITSRAVTNADNAVLYYVNHCRGACRQDGGHSKICLVERRDLFSRAVPE